MKKAHTEAKICLVEIFPILKDYQKFTGGKDGGFVTVDCSEFDGFEGLDKARINVR